jgi:hypothetical protein
LTNNQEYITAWGNRNTLLTWMEFNDGSRDSYISSPSGLFAPPHPHSSPAKKAGTRSPSQSANRPAEDRR